jgi:Zn-dependent peptidase ImmA (M78 family)
MSFPESMADRVIDKLPILIPDDLLLLDRIVWARGARLLEEPIDGADAQLLLIPGHRAIITVSSRIANEDRKRFSIAHELGHLEMHRKELRIGNCTRNDISDFKKANQPDLEQEANLFASCFLMPARFVSEYYVDALPSIDTIRNVAAKFAVSLTAAALRFIRFSSEPVAVVYLQAGRIQWFESTKEFADLGIFVDVGGMIDSDTVAGKLFRDVPVPDKWHETRASAWLREGNFRSDALIQEWSISMKKYKGVLSLLWIEDELDDDDD